ncbi:hypothetical protein CWS20_22225 [Cytobacillus horneckiae]|uniref:Uncharacterized protein n=1 Tax=Cytobacillus horneckiae TaxID=549687 RepID=A0A2N0ZBC6_9BACI|nr:hypothetical protein CWS20_22225 [Cytobacillus horneckiae]
MSAVQGTYCWGGLIKSACADPISPPDLISSHCMKPVVLSPIAKNEPKKYIGSNEGGLVFKKLEMCN